MRTVKYFLLGILTMGVVGLGVFHAREDKPKYSIEEVMDIAHDMDTGLLKKLATGKASKEEKAKLLEAYVALSKNKPPQGSPEEWKKKTEALVKATKAAIDSDTPGSKELVKASNCKDCHSVFKPKK